MILPDFLAPGLRVVFCGTAAGRISAACGHYYANAGNRFWRLLAQTGITPDRLRPDQDHLVLSYGIGLTDLAKTAFGQDADIPPQAWDAPGLMAKIAAAAPLALAFTSLTAARLALGRADVRPGQQIADARLPATALWALPSPSGLARSHFSAEPWQDLAEWCGAKQ
jgi:TDG/mug DNA glycosylase family protein